jgi:hypothetical protein
MLTVEGFDQDKLRALHAIFKARVQIKLAAVELEALSGEPVPELPPFRWIDHLNEAEAEAVVGILMERWKASTMEAA